VTPSLVRPCGGRFVEPSSAVVYCLLPSRPLPVTHHVLVASRATSVAVSKPAVLASTVACGGGHSHPYRPGPGPGSAGRPGRTRLPVTSRPTSVRCRGGLMLRTSGIRCPGSGHRHIDGAEGAPALPQTRVPARVCTGPMHRPERDRGFSANLQAKPPGSRSAAGGSPLTKGPLMPTVTAGQENNSDIEIYYEDHGVSSDGLKPHDDTDTTTRSPAPSSTGTFRSSHPGPGRRQHHAVLADGHRARPPSRPGRRDAPQPLPPARLLRRSRSRSDSPRSSARSSGPRAAGCRRLP